MQDYKPNSNRFKEQQREAALEERKPPEKKVEKVVSGGATSIKKSGVRKTMDNFVANDLASIKDYVVHDVMIPTIKNTVWDIFTNALDIVLFKGEGRIGGRKSGDRTATRNYVNYNRMSDSRSTHRSNEQRRNAFSFDDILFDTKADAEEVLYHLNSAIAEYRIATVADLYDLAGITGEYTYQDYGWTNLSNAKTVRVRDGRYVIDLPRALPIER